MQLLLFISLDCYGSECLLDCHVNRTPCSGTVEQILYKPGKFLNASFDKASEDNERNYYKIKNSHGEEIIVVQKLTD